jgi:hypothetical protein
MSDTDADTDADTNDADIIQPIKNDIAIIIKFVDINSQEINIIINIIIEQAIHNNEFKDDAGKVVTNHPDSLEYVKALNLFKVEDLLINKFTLYNFYIVIRKLVDSFKTFLIIKNTYDARNNYAWFSGLFTNSNNLYYGANKEKLSYNIDKVYNKHKQVIDEITTHDFFDYEMFLNKYMVNDFFILTDKNKYYRYWEKNKSLIVYDSDVLIHKETKYETPYPTDEQMRDEFNTLNNIFKDDKDKKDNTVLIWKYENSKNIKYIYMQYIKEFKEYIDRDMFDPNWNLQQINKDKDVKERISLMYEDYASFLITCIKKFNIIKNLTERIVTIFFTTSETTTSETTTEIKKITDIAKSLIKKIETLYTGYQIYIINLIFDLELI